MCNYFECRICKNSKNNVEYCIKEMMYGERDSFSYFKCGYCGCLQIKDIPNDLGKYYPKNYYSFNVKQNFFRNYLNKKRDLYSVKKNTLIGKILVKKFGNTQAFEWIKDLNLISTSKILDVGCGNGNLLTRLLNFGFTELYGIDPFLINDKVNNKIRLFKTTIQNFDINNFDLIMLHHSLEHLEDHHEIFENLFNLLKVNKYVIIRIPIIDTFAWNHYGINWVQLDAPRHLYLHSIKSITLLANQNGFELANYFFDSTSFQFWGSEQYKQNIPLFSENSFLLNPSKSIFTKNEIKEFDNKAENLNKNNNGDQVVLFFKKVLI